MVGLAADRVAVVAISQLLDDTCNTFVGLEARRRESYWAAEQLSHFGVRIGYVLRDHGLREFKETTAPYHVIGAAVLAEFVACCRQFLQSIDKRAAYRTRQQGLEDKSRPSDLLDQMHRFHVVEFGL